ncbi:MAG: hypothetical protein K0R25_395 [Rickettsiaceae bacterium]|jgi:hypothetical protein|nr:hypothetical protein [Rickettsiaceae bacterium]
MDLKDSDVEHLYKCSFNILADASVDALHFLPPELRGDYFTSSVVWNNADSTISGPMEKLANEYKKREDRDQPFDHDGQVQGRIDACLKFLSSNKFNSIGLYNNGFFTNYSYALYCIGLGYSLKAKYFNKQDKKPGSARFQEYQELVDKALFYYLQSIKFSNELLPRKNFVHILDHFDLETTLVTAKEGKNGNKNNALELIHKAHEANKTKPELEKDKEPQKLEAAIKEATKKAPKEATKEVIKEAAREIAKEAVKEARKEAIRGAEENFISSMEKIIEKYSKYTGLAPRQIESLSKADKKAAANEFHVVGSAYYHMALNFLKNSDSGKLSLDRFTLSKEFFLVAEEFLTKSYSLNQSELVSGNLETIKRFGAIFERSMAEMSLPAVIAQEEKQRKKQEKEREEREKEKKLSIKIYEAIKARRPDAEIPAEMESKSLRDYIDDIVRNYQNREDRSQAFDHEAMQKAINICFIFVPLNEEPSSNSDESFTALSYALFIMGLASFGLVKYIDESDNKFNEQFQDYQDLFNATWFFALGAMQLSNTPLLKNFFDDIKEYLKRNWSSFELETTLDMEDGQCLPRPSSHLDEKIYAAKGQADQGNILDRIHIIVREKIDDQGQEEGFPPAMEEMLELCCTYTASWLGEGGKLKEYTSSEEKEGLAYAFRAIGIIDYYTAYHLLKNSVIDACSINKKIALLIKENFKYAEKYIGISNSLIPSEITYRNFEIIKGITNLFDGYVRQIKWSAADIEEEKQEGRDAPQFPDQAQLANQNSNEVPPAQPFMNEPSREKLKVGDEEDKDPDIDPAENDQAMEKEKVLHALLMEQYEKMVEKNKGLDEREGRIKEREAKLKKEEAVRKEQEATLKEQQQKLTATTNDLVEQEIETNKRQQESLKREEDGLAARKKVAVEEERLEAQASRLDQRSIELTSRKRALEESQKAQNKQNEKFEQDLGQQEKEINDRQEELAAKQKMSKELQTRLDESAQELAKQKVEENERQKRLSQKKEEIEKLSEQKEKLAQQFATQLQAEMNEKHQEQEGREKEKEEKRRQIEARREAIKERAKKLKARDEQSEFLKNVLVTQEEFLKEAGSIGQIALTNEKNSAFQQAYLDDQKSEFPTARLSEQYIKFRDHQQRLADEQESRSQRWIQEAYDRSEQSRKKEAGLTKIKADEIKSDKEPSTSFEPQEGDAMLLLQKENER